MKSPTGPKPSKPSAPPFSREVSAGPGLQDEESLAIYIHWPYCEAKCPYCDFNSYARRSIGEQQYVTAAVRELGSAASETDGRTVSSVFFGGGTPSLMAPASVGALLAEIARNWTIEGACEITLEANPSSVEASRFAGYRAAGVNRVSLGVQSLDDGQLRFLGRLHTADEARQAIKLAEKHFERVSFDLIYARPGQTEAAWAAELAQALELASGHLSLYQLTIEPETAFFDLHRRGKLRIPQADLAADLYGLTQEMCERAGLPAYEISNHAAQGEESRHNLTYWRHGDYLGVGPGAHGRVTISGQRYATAAIKDPAAWCARVLEFGAGLAERAELGSREQAEEMVLMGLRLSEGIDEDRLEAKTGFSLASRETAALEIDGLIVRSGRRLCATNSGRLVLNAIVNALVDNLSESAARQF